MTIAQQYDDASKLTSDQLRTIAHTKTILDLSSLSLPEIDKIVDMVSKMVPAGNVPGVILNGLSRLSERRLPAVKKDINLLFKGVEQTLKDKAVYSTFFMGPAAVIGAYQYLLKLTGKDLNTSFPDGTWQFYIEYALRDDTARHAYETHGFDSLLEEHQVSLPLVDRLTAWVMAGIYTLHQYNHLLENEWRERVFLYNLQQLTKTKTDSNYYAALYRQWEKKRPYRRESDVNPQDNYPTYRQFKFDEFLTQVTRNLPPNLHQEWQAQNREALAADLPAYQKQMSILAYLNPTGYGETRAEIPLAKAHIGLIYQGHYYLLPACLPQENKTNPLPADIHTIRTQVATILAHPVKTPPTSLQPLAQVKRVSLSTLLTQSKEGEWQQALNTLRLAPIWINGDVRSTDFPLAGIRQAERGIGDHAITIFDTQKTFVFDLSHIFFDGTWGAALSEIMTNEALSWAVYLQSLPAIQAGKTRPYAPTITLDTTPIQQMPQVAAEASVESAGIDIKAILKLRKLFKLRSDLLQLTVNDLLILYRAIHAATYQPSAGIVKQLQQLKSESATRVIAESALLALDEAQAVNPAILIPVDASQRSPRDRLYPMAFEVPLVQLDLLSLHEQTCMALETWQEVGAPAASLTAFDELQRQYLGTLAGFGTVMSKAKEIAILGESASVGAIKLMAHMPAPLLRLFDQIPRQFDVLNDLIKGREVFSNIGQVASNSTLTRFMTAKDDNEKKTLAWSVLTDAQGVMHIALRDFRPHVAQLTSIGQHQLATDMAQHYLDAYVKGLNTFIRDLYAITEASTQPSQR